MAFRSLFAHDENGQMIFNPAAMADMDIERKDAIYSICGNWFAFRGGREYGPFASVHEARRAMNVEERK